MKTLINLLAATAMIPISAAHGASSGIGGGDLSSRVDAKIEAAMSKNNIPGMTVAVTVDGRLVYSKGFGYANAVTKQQMTQNMRTKIGSVSKVVVTSAAAMKLMKKNGIDPKTKKVYGPGGVFGGKFKWDIKLGAARFSPIAGMAINKNNKTYAWYVDGKVSVGKTFDLDREQAPKTYKLPAGYRVTDIRDMAISDNDRVYTWYNDGAVSVGSSRNLGPVRKVVVDGKEETLKVKMPAGQSMMTVTGIAIAKTGEDTDHVYVWYEDGTLSSGTTTDFTKHFTGRKYKVAGAKPYDIRAMAISKDDKVFAWLLNGKAQSGTSRDLGKHRAPYDYTTAPQGRSGGPLDREKWAHDITIHHLLNHRAGYQRNAGKGGAKMFGKPEDQMTYELIHRYMLRTKPLKWAPGEASQYSNHGFGVWTIMFPELVGKSYRNYAINNYLKPLGLKGAVRPATSNLDHLDSRAHSGKKGDYKLLEPKDSTLGLAAGGWTASASSLLRITRHLVDTYSHQQLDDLGWGSNNKGRLSHNGLLGGGAAYVSMYPPGYVASGQNIGGIHIALAANIRTSTSALSELAGEIAVQVPQSGIGQNFDLWQGIQ